MLFINVNISRFCRLCAILICIHYLLITIHKSVVDIEDCAINLQPKPAIICQDIQISETV